jgi:hypothetical protein
MEVQTLQMDPRIARIHWRDYHKKVLDHRKKRMEEARAKVLAAGRDLRAARSTKSLIEKEDEQLAAAYHAMMRGERILNINTVIPKVGLQEKIHMPKIAIGRATWKTVQLSDEHQHIIFAENRWLDWDWRRNVFKTPHVMIPRGLFKAELLDADWRKRMGIATIRSFEAIVPSVPAHLRPDDLDTNQDYYILWEAEWRPHQAPVDPFLLRHVEGGIYSVVAQWDLTPLEQSILEGRP